MQKLLNLFPWHFVEGWGMTQGRIHYMWAQTWLMVAPGSFSTCSMMSHKRLVLLVTSGMLFIKCMSVGIWCRSKEISASSEFKNDSVRGLWGPDFTRQTCRTVWTLEICTEMYLEAVGLKPRGRTTYVCKASEGVSSGRASSALHWEPSWSRSPVCCSGSSDSPDTHRGWTRPCPSSCRPCSACLCSAGSQWRDGRSVHEHISLSARNLWEETNIRLYKRFIKQPLTDQFHTACRLEDCGFIQNVWWIGHWSDCPS